MSTPHMDESGTANLPLGESVRYLYVCAGCGSQMSHATPCVPGCDSVEAEPVQVVSAAAYEELRAQHGRLQAAWLRGDRPATERTASNGRR